MDIKQDTLVIVKRGNNLSPGIVTYIRREGIGVWILDRTVPCLEEKDLFPLFQVLKPSTEKDSLTWRDKILSKTMDVMLELADKNKTLLRRTLKDLSL